MASVSIDGVHKYFGQTHIIKGVSVEIEDGEFCVLVGPSGCGKSTLLRLIAGLEDVTSGSVSINGKDVTDLPPAERRLAILAVVLALFSVGLFIYGLGQAMPAWWVD